MFNNQRPLLQDIYRLALPFGLLVILVLSALGEITLAAAAAVIPLVLVVAVSFLRKPLYLFYSLFGVNYFLLGITRYVPISGVSLLTDIMIALLFVLLIFHNLLYQNVPWKNAKNILTYTTIIWAAYCVCQVANPTAVVSAWALSRGLIITGVALAVLTSVFILRFSQVRFLFIMLAIFSLLAVVKTMMQKYGGFDAAEWRWLNEGGGGKTHLIFSGTRYFSFFTDAGNMGSNMGASTTFFAVAALYDRNRWIRLFYLFVSLASCYAMFLSGTRGAIIVPLAGVAAFVVLSKNTKLVVVSSLGLLAIYIFFAFTTIGQGNAQIRRMRTAFKPSADASFNVRKINQEKLAGYLKNKPFGEGLGLSGVENQKVSMRFTTSIPNDSWYVKIWVETGVVGLMLYLGMLIITFFRATYLILFRIRHVEVRGYMAAILCGVFGLSVSAYGNPFWGQYPTHILVFMLMGILMNAEIIDNNISSEQDNLL